MSIGDEYAVRLSIFRKSDGQHMTELQHDMSAFPVLYRAPVPILLSGTIEDGVWWIGGMVWENLVYTDRRMVADGEYDDSEDDDERPDNSR